MNEGLGQGELVDKSDDGYHPRSLPCMLRLEDHASQSLPDLRRGLPLTVRGAC